MKKNEKATQAKNDKTVQGKNGLRNYDYKEVKRGKKEYIEYPHCYQEWTNLFYTKKCLYCSKEFEAQRVDTTFCGQACQKADLRMRKKQL